MPVSAVALVGRVVLMDLFGTPYERGIAESDKAANRWTPDELAAVDAAIRRCCYFYPEWTADDVWQALGRDFKVTKGLAARLNKAANDGWIRATDRTRKSRRKDQHGHGQRHTIWESLRRE